MIQYKYTQKVFCGINMKYVNLVCAIIMTDLTCIYTDIALL